MSVASDVMAAMAFSGYPCAQNEYTGKEPVYFVFNLNTIPTNYANNNPLHERYLVQLHLYAPQSLNTTVLQKQIKHALCAAGFLYPSQENASDETGQHIVFETETTEAV